MCSLCCIVCSGGSTDQTTAVNTTTSTTANTMSTESDNKQQEGSTTSTGEVYSFTKSITFPCNACDCVVIDAILIAITIGVIAAIGGALITVVIIGIICCRKYKKRHSKGKIEWKNEVQYDGKRSIFFPLLM